MTVTRMTFAVYQSSRRTWNIICATIRHRMRAPTLIACQMSRDRLFLCTVYAQQAPEPNIYVHVHAYDQKHMTKFIDNIARKCCPNYNL
eukprot:4822716-Karenia_brevis.AAC.1